MAAELDDELVMMNLNSNAYYGLDDIGTAIWSLLETPITVQQLCSLLSKKFVVDPLAAQKDVLQFLNELHQEKVIVCIE
jgi:hypothetical protein